MVGAPERKDKDMVKVASMADNFCSQWCKMPHINNLVSGTSPAQVLHLHQNTDKFNS